MGVALKLAVKKSASVSFIPFLLMKKSKSNFFQSIYVIKYSVH